MPFTIHQTSPPDTRQTLRDLTALFVLAAVVQTWCVVQAAVPALDCVRFVERAKAIGQLDPLSAIAGDTEQPLFPLVIAAVHRTWQLLAPHSASWATTAQTTAALCLVLCVGPLYCAVHGTLNRQAAIVGTAVFCLLPEVARLGADGTSDSLHLLLFTSALWASFRALTATRWRSIWYIATGTLIALAVLTRAEALVLLPAIWLAVVITGRPWQCWTNFRGASRIIAYGTAGFTLVLAPYFCVTGVATTRDVVDRTLGRPTRETTAATVDVALPTKALVDDDLLTTKAFADAAPLVFAAREPGPSSRRRGVAAALLGVARELSATFHYLAGGLVLLGVITAMPSSSGDQRTWLTLVVCLTFCYLAAAGVLAAREGYLSARHLVPLVPATIGWMRGGAGLLAQWITPNRSVPPTRGFVTVGIVGVVMLSCVPRTAAPLHASRAPHRQASDWLADSARSAGAVLDTRGWTGLYTRRPTYDYTGAAMAFTDPALAYVVIERREVESTSDRAATLRRLLDIAARPDATFTADARRRERDVLVFRWHGEKFRQALADTATPQRVAHRHQKNPPHAH